MVNHSKYLELVSCAQIGWGALSCGSSSSAFTHAISVIVAWYGMESGYGVFNGLIYHDYTWYVTYVFELLSR